MRKHNNIPNSGFTLIEVLLGILLLSFISVCVAGTFRAGIAISQRYEKQNAVFRHVQLVLNRFSRDVESVVFYDYSGSYKDSVAFEGKNDAVTFLILSGGKLKVVAYYLSDEGTIEIKRTILGRHYKRNVAVTQSKQSAIPTANLIREEMDFRDYLAAGLMMHGDKNVMIENVALKGLSFGYATPASGNSESISWRPEWRQPSLPAAVTMKLEYVDGVGAEKRTLNFEKAVLLPAGMSFEKKVDKG